MSCLNSSSASELRPDFINCSAWVYCCAARGGIATGSGAAGLAAVTGGAATGAWAALPVRPVLFGTVWLAELGALVTGAGARGGAVAGAL